MFTSIVFCIGEKVLGLNDREYPLGELTAEVLNISPEAYHELRRMLDRAMNHMNRYEEEHQMQDWFDANEEMIQLHESLTWHRIFRLTQSGAEVLYEFFYVLPRRLPLLSGSQPRRQLAGAGDES